MATEAIRIRGLKELNRAFAVANREMQKDLRAALDSAASPVRRDAQANALALGVGVTWSSMRTGVTRSSVYVAPVARGTRVTGRKRSRFATFLMDRAMSPALEANRDKVIDEIEDAIGDMARAWENV